MKIIPTKAAKLSSVNLVKYLTKDDMSKATIRMHKPLDQIPIHKRLGGFQLEFVSISRFINHMTC